MKSSTETLINALHILAQEIESPDGVANQAIAEAAERLQELSNDVLVKRVAELSAERDNAWAELREIRKAINAHPEESTADEVRRVSAKLEQLRKDAFIAIDAAQDMNVDMQKAIRERDLLKSQFEQLQAFRDEVVGVMNNSSGVTGWHLNGDVATWDEILPDVPTGTPAQCLAEIKAQAVDGFSSELKDRARRIPLGAEHEGHGKSTYNWQMFYAGVAENYANQIRQQSELSHSNKERGE